MPYPEQMIGRPHEYVGIPEVYHGTNATLEDHSVLNKEGKFDKLKLWVYEITADFTLAGTTGQGVYKRDLYPHNFVQPSFTFRCQSPNQEHRARAAEFIRRAQLRSLRGQGLLRIYVPAAGTERVRFINYRNKKTGKVTTRRIRRNQKGVRAHLALEGYIQNAPRGAERWVNAPDFEFNFIVSRSLAGPFEDNPVNTAILKDVKTWTQLLTGKFIDDPSDKPKPKAKPPVQTKDEDDYQRPEEVAEGTPFDLDLPNFSGLLTGRRR